MHKVERWSHQRKPYDAPVDYSTTISKPCASKIITITETVRGIDISKKGMGIVTSFPLMPNHILALRGLDGKSFPKKAVVRWRAKRGLWYRVGLMFI